MPMFRKLVPMLQTKNMGQTIGWYEKVLGFQQTSPQVSGWCCLSRDGVSIMFMDNAHLGSPHATATQYFTVDDVDALWDDVVRPNGGRRTCLMDCGSLPSRIPMATF
jgi:uncharacterized glyoxalase superfamily protein PhnB